MKRFVYNLQGVKVSDAAQLTAFLGIQSEIWRGLYIGLDATFADYLFADFNELDARKQSVQNVWRLPAYYVLDARVGWSNIVLKNKWRMSVIGNVYNLTDNRYIIEGTSGSANNRETSRYYYGQNISYLLTLRFNFG